MEAVIKKYPTPIPLNHQYFTRHLITFVKRNGADVRPEAGR